MKTRQFTREHRPEQVSDSDQILEAAGSLEMSPPSFEPVQYAQAQAPSGPVAAGPVAQRQEDEEEKKGVPEGYGTQSENPWKTDGNGGNGGPLHESRNAADVRLAELQASGMYEEVELKAKPLPSGETMYEVKTRGERTTGNFISLVEKVEGAYPDASPEEVTDMLRSVSGYNDNKWATMLGEDGRLPTMQPVDGKLTEEDISSLTAMMAHQGDQVEDERGMAMGPDGNYVAMGHVVTGMAAGFNHNPNTDFRSGGQQGLALIPELFTLGTANTGAKMDNLYASTIGGDLGQAAVNHNLEGGGPFVGPGSEATSSEIYGDLDGFNLGTDIKNAEEGEVPAVSDMLRDYYEGVAEDGTGRFDDFQETLAGRGTGHAGRVPEKVRAKRKLRRQSSNFAENYMLGANDKGGGIGGNIDTLTDSSWRGLGDDVSDANDAFWDFFDEERERAQEKKDSMDNPDGAEKSDSTDEAQPGSGQNPD